MEWSRMRVRRTNVWCLLLGARLLACGADEGSPPSKLRGVGGQAAEAGMGGEGDAEAGAGTGGTAGKSGATAGKSGATAGKSGVAGAGDAEGGAAGDAGEPLLPSTVKVD